MDNKHITDVIYDTLMQNKQHEQLNIDKVENPVVERKRGWITFDYGDIVVMLLEQQILAGIVDGSLDSGMGYESLIGAVMNIETIDKREIDGKTFIAIKQEINCYGELSEEQEDFLIELIESAAYI